ncbi:MAG: hypothetical protein OXE98_03240 [Hyphomicrobiales bacterium]|nr:hypothetical protein [Hyphomicrobiales bacterium]
MNYFRLGFTATREYLEEWRVVASGCRMLTNNPVSLLGESYTGDLRGILR